MKGDEVVEIPNGLEEEVSTAVRVAGIRGLDADMAQELGVFQRISFMLCLMHSCVSVAYRVYGQVDYMLDQLNGKRHEIGSACKQFERDYDRFMSFWRRKYQTAEGVKEMNKDTEALYHNIMRWAQLPERWRLGDPMHTQDATDMLIRVDMGDRDLKFHRSTLESEALEDVVESWCVTKLDVETKKQETVYTGMDKASAQMSAKRLSAEDRDNIYTASILQTIVEKRVDALPMKAYRNGDVVGRIGKEFKK